MKKLSLLSLALFALCCRSAAQAAFTTMDSVDINNITAAVLVHGDMWWNPTDYSPHCSFPKHASTHANFAGSLWMSAYDGASQLHVAAQTYRQDGNDYWPGPLDASDTLTYSTSQSWAKIWKVNRTDIQGFRSLSTHTIANTPQSILTWPAKGNTHAQGNGGVALTVTNAMAPFVDLNNNGIYEPLSGEYPDVPGDQALWWVFSDNGPAHSQTHGKPLGVEIHAMAYAYARQSAADNIIYYDYNLVNKSANNYSNFRIGQWDNATLGYYLDDFIGFDSVWRMGIGYNSSNDDGLAGGHPAGSYGVDPPQMGITMVVLPGDAGTSYVPAGSFMSYNNDFSLIGNPTNDSQINYYLHAKIRDGKPIDSIFTGAQPCGVTNHNYLFPGDPSNTAQWSECNCGNTPGQRNFILASNDFTLPAGGTAHAVFALVIADSAKGCPAVNFNSIRNLADTAWNLYHHPLPPLPLAVSSIITTALKLYPDPAHDRLYLSAEGPNTSDGSITIYNMLGQAIHPAVSNNGRQYEIDVRMLPAGLYNVVFHNNNTITHCKFLKE